MSPKDDLPPIVWNKKIPNTNLEKFQKIVEEKYNEHFESYWDVHKWSIENFPLYWKEVWHYFEIVHSKPYDKVFEKTGPGFLDCEWFSGMRFNFAQNILRIRNDSIAIIYADEYGCEETVTFAEMFEEVKVYAAAFKKNGLRKGDRVACYMSNRKENVFAYLATTSIGAIFGGPQPYLQSKSASRFINRLEAKFLLSVDHHSENGKEFHNIDNLSEIANNAVSLEKVIIVPTRSDTYSRDLSNIKNGCLLKDFLESGRNIDGTVPDLKFEQLPFDHPICINFTSGTTGEPKGAVHSAGTILPLMTHVVFSWNLKAGDVLYTKFPYGWSMWATFIPCLATGVTLFLYSGSPTFERLGINIWDIFSKFKVTFTFQSPTNFDAYEKLNSVPGPHTNLDNLKIITMGGNPPKPQNFLFVRNKIKEDAMVCSQYGVTESLSAFTAVCWNLPCYAGEIQAPHLGMDMKCFDEEGKMVVNKRGEMVLATPTPSLPLYFWRDEDNRILRETYLSKYPGFWNQGDVMWINPKTRGFKIIGRIDAAIEQKAHIFLPGDIYGAIHDLEDIFDCICVEQRSNNGKSRAVLFIKMKSGRIFTKELKKNVEQNISSKIGSKCVPELILETKDIPYNLNNKKMESLLRRILATNQVQDVSNVKNPECLMHYFNIPEIQKY